MKTFLFRIINDSEESSVVPCVEDCKQGEIHDSFEEFKGQNTGVWKTLVKEHSFPRGPQTTKQNLCIKVLNHVDVIKLTFWASPCHLQCYTRLYN